MASLEKKYLRTVSVNNNSKTVQMTDGKGFNIYPKTTVDSIEDVDSLKPKKQYRC